MFSFLNRNKAPTSTLSTEIKTNETHSNEDQLNSQLSEQNLPLIEPKQDVKLNEYMADAKKNLYEAIIHRRTDIVVSILNQWFKDNQNSDESVKYFFNSNYCENETTSPLLIAYHLKDRDLIRTLLNFGADPGLTDSKSKKCLIELINEDDSADAEPMRQLLSDSFMQSIVQNNLISLAHYLHAGFDVNNSSVSLPDKNSYLHWACMFSNESVVRLLLENGAIINSINKNGATPLHEAILRNNSKEESLKIIETLLIYKSDALNIKATSGIYKDLCALELAQTRSQTEPEIYNLIKEFLSDVSSVKSVPHSPITKALSEPTDKTNSAIIHSLDSISAHNESNVSSSSRKSISNDLENLQNWSSSSLTPLAEPETKPDLKSQLWPQPQSCTILSENERFYLPNTKTQPLFIYFKPPYTYTYMDLINKLASAFSGITFYCIHRPDPKIPYISVSIDKNFFQNQSAYSILVTKSKIEINAIDSVSLQYAFFTFMQLCKIYSRSSIPSLRILDYSDVKYRAVLLDFSQGFYFKYENLLAVLQMMAFYKINQVHFYVKFSSLPPACDKKQWYNYIENWFGLMKFCEEVNLEIVPSIDITTDVAELCDVIIQIKEYLDLFKGFRFVNIGPRLSSLLTCMDDKNPFSLDSTQYMMLCSYLYHNGDEETLSELEKFDKYVLMEYGLKSGTDFGSKSANLYKSGHPFYFCIGSANWNSLLGCPDGCLNNINDAVQRHAIDQPIGFLMCNFSGSINRNPFAYNLNSILMFSGMAWNTKISMTQAKASLPLVMVNHGLISDKDGEIAKCMLELGHVETYLTRIASNSKDYKDLPYDEGSIFTRLLYNPDEVDLDNLDKHIIKKTLFHLRAQQSKLKSLLDNPVNSLFKEVLISTEIAYHLFKFLICLYNNGTKQQFNSNKAVGLHVINIGVANLSQTIRTDLANKLLIIKQEYQSLLSDIYFYESVEEYLNNYFMKLIDKLLVDQDEANLADLVNFKSIRNNGDNGRLRSFSQSSVQSNYYIQYSNDEKY
ncbi:unnamed protein product [Brachionus calyciflorus]|uniref:Beta-N-acetylhexosaminidase n=1 Tax=Brachionus calyciflorus TaxID=104777 RepID=A0A813LWY5_9BILA|nr:unnamed protein product [Brachionus calyciflorus]